MFNKKIKTLTLIGLLSVSMVGCSSPKEMLREWLLGEDVNLETQQQVVAPHEEEFSENVETAYNAFLPSANKSIEEMKEPYHENITFIKEKDGVGFVIEFNQPYLEEVIKTRGDIKSGLIDTNMEHTRDSKQQLIDILGIEDVDVFVRIVAGGKTYIEVRDGELTILDLGDEEFESQIMNELLGVNENNEKKEVKKETPKPSDDPMAESNGRHMESTAPYGRCPKCNCANASDKGYQGDYCDDCFAEIKEEDYKEKHKYGDCIDCGVYLSKNQADTYGGRCPECYARYYDPNFDNSNMGYCERCGDSVDMRYTNDGWGYTHLCSACTGELQSEESSQDANPYAG